MTIAAKICGLKTREALDVALEAGADYVGLVFFPKSPRNVDMETARELATAVRGRAQVVALMVDPTDEQVLDVVEHVSPDAVQLHGGETPQRVADFRARLGRQVWKAIKVETASDAAEALRYQDAADLILFDAKAPKGAELPGGNGVPFDWRALEEVRHNLALPWMLSGGLNPENVTDAIRLTRARAVDVSSGVESSPGIKDPGLIRRFLSAVKAANQGI